jgi:hypothetical protein
LDLRIVIAGIVIFVLSLIFLPFLAFFGILFVIAGLARRRPSRQSQNLPVGSKKPPSTWQSSPRYRSRPLDYGSAGSRTGQTPTTSQTPSWAQQFSQQPPQVQQRPAQTPQPTAMQPTISSPSEALGVLRNMAMNGAQSEDERTKVSQAYSMVTGSMSGSSTAPGKDEGLLGDPVLSMMLLGIFLSSLTNRSQGERRPTS